MFACQVCEKSFTRADALARHGKTHNGVKFSCSLCPKTFGYQTNLRRHMTNVHHVLTAIDRPAPQNDALVVETGPSSYEWDSDEDLALCEVLDSVERDVAGNRVEKRVSDMVGRVKRARLELVGCDTGFVEVNASHQRKVIWFYYKNQTNFFNYHQFLNHIKPELIEKLSAAVNIRPIKFNLKLEATYAIPNVENSAENRAFKSTAISLYEDSDIKQIVDKTYDVIMAEQDSYVSKGSGFTLQCIDGVLLGIYHYSPINGSSYIPLPEDIKFKKAVINPQNDDQKCFIWAILARHVEIDHRYRVGENYTQHEDKYNFNGISFPTPLHEIKKFEKNNPSVSVNVYGLKQEKKDKKIVHTVFPLKVVDDEKLNHFDLLLISDDKNSHYTYISNFSRLVRSQKTSNERAIVLCKRCFTSFNDRRWKYKLSGQAALDQHKLICGQHKPILPVMPKEGDVVEFEAWSKTQRHPVVIYADFESILEKTEEKKGQNTTIIQNHKPMSFGVYVKAEESVPVELLEQFNIPTAPIIYRGTEEEEGVAKKFIETVEELAKNIDKMLKTNAPINMTDEEKASHASVTLCNLCKNGFSTFNHKVADHNHMSGRFRQTLCNTCNLKLQMPNFVPCFLHNLSNYDAHFIVTELGYDTNKISVIPNSEEKYISFSKYINNTFTVRFIDTCRFMASSLSTLASNLLTPDFRKFRETAKHFSTPDLPLVTRKGVYPYEYTDSWSKLEEPRLPTREHFYSCLNEAGISEEDYQHALKIWDHFNCAHLGEFSDLYLLIDVLLLADVFENFRDTSRSTYNLDPAFYYTAPGFSFDCMLKYTKMKLELLSDYDMLLMVEKGIRGGLTQTSMRYAKANNHTTPDFDENTPKSWLVYQDCNNLYGWAMSQYMPFGEFKWVEPSLDGLNELTDSSPKGRMYEVDISYPQHLHDAHSDLPFLPENSIPPGSKIQKLMATFTTKFKYVIHYRNLKQAISNGLIVEKVHRVLEFNQSPWLADYINLNTEKRKQATNDFEKDFYKLMNNAVFGKTMENCRKRIKMELVSSSQRFQKLVNRTTFKYATTYNENLSVVSLENKIIDFNKPIYIGFAVLEVSKTLMYNYHYNVIKKYYNERATLMYTDTDSLIYFIKTKNFYHDLANNSILLDRMDTANLPHNHPCFIASRKKVPGYFSDETDGKTMTEFVALRAKSYAYTLEGKEKIKAKGIRGHVVKNHMTLEDHKKCLFGETGFNPFRENVSIRSFKHSVKTLKSKKLTYNSYDDKRHALEDRIHTLAHGHYRINEMQERDENV